MSKRQVNELPKSELSRCHPSRAVRHAPVLPQLVSFKEGAQRTELSTVSGTFPFDKLTRPAETRLLEAARGSVLKRLSDVLGALLLAAVFAPLIVTIVAIMSREEGGVLFKHRRIGRNGRVFECLKFRTMVPNADQVMRQLFEAQPNLKVEWINSHKLRNDPRVTRLGRFLRRTSLDELPQLWNVLRGDMSLVGPRPIVREELIRYGRCSQSYLSVKPGITGLWQVTGRNDTNYRRRVALDVYYVRNRSLLLDAYILVKTTRVVLAGDGAY